MAKIRATWYRATFESGHKTYVSCCPDCGTVSLAWNRKYEDLRDWNESALRDLLESTFGEAVTSLVAR